MQKSIFECDYWKITLYGNSWPCLWFGSYGHLGLVGIVHLGIVGVLAVINGTLRAGHLATFPARLWYLLRLFKANRAASLRNR